MKTLIPETKICVKCGKEKTLSEFSFRKDTGKYRKECRECKKEYNKNYYSNNSEEIIKNSINYAKNNKDVIDAYQKTYRIEYYRKNKEKINNAHREYYEVNKDIILDYRSNRRKQDDSIREYFSAYEKERRRNDPSFKLRKDLSRVIQLALKENNGSKHNFSVMDYLPYTIEELRKHLESQFEPWMSWNNHGIYRRLQYVETDPSTWTWHIDHIIPQSMLPYFSMEDDNFKKCWSLDNLRPLKSIDNIKKSNKHHETI